MSDELVDRLRDFDPHQHEWEVVAEAADCIEALIEDRDKAYASGYSDAETEISKSALGQYNTFLHSQYVNAILRNEALTAERDRLRAALEDIADHDTGATAGLAYTAKIALKGETP